MIKFNLFTPSIFLLFLNANSVHSQTWPPGIDSLYIVPDEPSETDEIQLVIHATLHATPCHLVEDSVEIVVNENQIQIVTAYWTGWGAAGCYSIDTISLGQLAAGHYDLTAYFDHEIFTDEDSLSFFVGAPTNTAVNHESNLQLNIFPNPLKSTTLNVNYTLDAFSEIHMEIHDLTGKILIQKNSGPQQTGEHNVEMDLKNLPKGLYFLRLDTGESVHLEKLIVQ